MTPNVSSDKGKVEVANSPSACITGGVISTRQNLTAHPMDYTTMGTSAIVSSRFWFLYVLSIIHRPRLSAPTLRENITPCISRGLSRISSHSQKTKFYTPIHDAAPVTTRQWPHLSVVPTPESPMSIRNTSRCSLCKHRSYSDDSGRIY
jgi:hypothetical protein